MKKLMKKIVVGLSALTLLANSVCFASGTGNEFGELALESKIAGEQVIYSTDFSSDDYVRSLDGLTNADLVGKDYIPAYDANDKFGSNIMSQAARYTNDLAIPASVGSLLRDDGQHFDDGFKATNNTDGKYWPRPSGWYTTHPTLTQDIDAEGYYKTTCSGTYAANIIKTIQHFYRDYGPGKYRVEFKAKALNNAASGKNTQLHVKYNHFNQTSAGYKVDSSNGPSLTPNLSTSSWTTFSTEIVVPVVAENLFWNSKTYTSDVFTFDIRGGGSSSFNFAIDDFKIVKLLETGETVGDYAGKDLTIDHTIYANDKTVAKDAVVITALYNADGALEAAKTAPVSVAADVASVTTQTTVSVPSTATADWTVRSYLWTDITDDISPYGLATDTFDGNLIENGSFEIIGTDSTDNVAKYWSGRSGVPVVDTTYAHTGKYSLKTDATNKTFQYTKFKDNLTSWGAGTYKLSFWIKTDSEATLRAMGVLRNASGSDQVAVYRNIKADEGWVQCTTDAFTISSVAASGPALIIGYDISDAGNVWIDDVVVEKIN